MYESKHVIIALKYLTPETFILRLNKGEFEFTAGHHVLLELENDPNFREYSIYSGTADNNLEFLIRVVENGYFTQKLKKMKVGDAINVIGPCGHFFINNQLNRNKHFVFIATGTGIAPFHSFIKSHQIKDYTLIHGIRYLSECYERLEYNKGNYIACTSQDPKGEYHGRVSSYIREHLHLDEDTLVYLCGNYKMIDEVKEILVDKGLSLNNIFTEAFFKF